MLRECLAAMLVFFSVSTVAWGSEEALIFAVEKPVSTESLRSLGLIFLGDVGTVRIFEGDENSALRMVDAGIDFDEVLNIEPGQEVFLLRRRGPSDPPPFPTALAPLGDGTYFVAARPTEVAGLDTLPFLKVRLLPGPYPELAEPALPHAVGPASPDRHIETMVSRVSEDTLWKYVSELSGHVPVIINARWDTLLTRYSHSWRIDHAADYLRESFETYGIDVTFDPYVVGKLAFYSASFADSSNGWVVGNGPWVYRTGDGGVSWEHQEINAPYHSFWGVCFIDWHRGWICGTGGKIYQTRDGGQIWSMQPTPGGMNLEDICFLDSLNGWVVGHGGLILRTTDGGTSWVEVESGTTNDLYGLDFRSCGRGWACGDLGLILFWDGSQWSVQAGGTTGQLMDIDFRDDYSGLAVGGEGRILKTEDGGLSWTASTVPDNVSPFLKGVAFSSATEAWVVGLNGTILHSSDDGATWELQESRTLFGLRRVEPTSSQEAWVVGYGSTVLHTADGGTTWESQRENLPSEALIRLKNVVATKPGTASDEQVIICGHFDSTSEDPYNHAPGADDNATGTAAVMETARILAGLDFERTIKFVCFSGEEQGLFGSGEYAGEVRSAGAPIVAVLNFDMIGYSDTTPEDIDIVGNPASEWLVDLAAECAGTYVPSLGSVKLIDPTMVYGDHASFWKAGYAAILSIEDIDIPYPYYHTSGDTVGNLNRTFLSDVVRMGVSVVAHLASPDTMGPGADPSSGIRISEARPNPFKLETSVRFSTGLSGNVEVAVVDVRGRMVRAVSNAWLPAGGHFITWDGRDERGRWVAPGIYFIRVKVGDDRDGTKVVFLR